MRRESGFSIVELVVTLAVAAILLAIATPSLGAFFRTNRLAASTNDVVLSLQLARAEAARRGRAVSLCRSSDGSTCTAGAAWAGGWIVFQDANAAGTPAPTSADSELIRVFQPLDEGLTLTAPADYVRFRADGSLDWTGVAASVTERAFDLRVSGCRGNQQRRISIGRLGRVRSAPQVCS